MRTVAPSPLRKSCKRYNDPGHAHFLTFSCFHQLPLLSRDRTRRWLVDSLDRARPKYMFDLWGYVIMPDHVHLVIFPRAGNYSISRILTAIKQPVAQRAIAYLRNNDPAFMEKLATYDDREHPTYHFWQRGGGYDRNLWSVQDVWEKIDYLHANPVRRGLCEKMVDWAWSSAADHSSCRSGPLKLDLHSIPERPIHTIR